MSQTEMYAFGEGNARKIATEIFLCRMFPMPFDRLILPSPSWTEVFLRDLEKPSYIVEVAETSSIGFTPAYLKSIKFDFVAGTATKYMLGKQCVGSSCAPNPATFNGFRMPSDIVMDFDREAVCNGVLGDGFEMIDFIAGASNNDGTWRSDE